jgi:hypothetical protein
MKEFECKDLGNLALCLGLEVQRNRIDRVIMLHQTAYIKQLLLQSNMFDCFPTSTPSNPTVRLCNYDVSKCMATNEKMKNVPYRAICGSLLYLSYNTRPDISFTVGQLCSYQENPGPIHWAAMKHLLKYPKGTESLGILWGGSEDLVLSAYADADWAGDIDSRRSKWICVKTWNWTHYLVKLAAKVRSCEAEYMAISLAAQEIMWAKQMLLEMGYDQSTTVCYEDNQGCIAFINSHKNSNRMKHVDIRYHFIREQVENGNIKVVYCYTKDMLADILTKGLPKQSFTYLRDALKIMPAVSLDRFSRSIIELFFNFDSHAFHLIIKRFSS